MLLVKIPSRESYGDIMYTLDSYMKVLIGIVKSFSSCVIVLKFLP